MNLTEVKCLLNEKRYKYELTTITRSIDFYKEKGFPSEKEQGPFRVLRVLNPNHNKHIEFVFVNTDVNPKLYDMFFGGFFYELFDCEEKDLENTIKSDLDNIVSGRTYVIFVMNENNRTWCGDSFYLNGSNIEDNNIDAFYKNVDKIKSQKSWLERLCNHKKIYEIYNWESYECVIR